MSLTFTRDLLDHGRITLIEHWGSDQRVVEAARMSTSKGFLGFSCWQCTLCGLELEGKQSHTSSPGVHCPNEDDFTRTPRDEKLLRYLWDNAHQTPFEMAGAIYEVDAPIAVYREWHRHRTMGYNELSARYTPLPNTNYVPSVERLMLGGGHLTKQAGTIKDASALTDRTAELYREQLKRHYIQDQALYEHALTLGVPKELARMHLPVGRYSRMRATCNLRNWLAFLTLRQDPKAQWEIRQYADAVHDSLNELFPHTMAIFDDDRLLRQAVAALVTALKAAGKDVVDALKLYTVRV